MTRKSFISSIHRFLFARSSRKINGKSDICSFRNLCKRFSRVFKTQDSRLLSQESNIHSFSPLDFYFIVPLLLVFFTILLLLKWVVSLESRAISRSRGQKSGFFVSVCFIWWDVLLCRFLFYWTKEMVDFDPIIRLSWNWFSRIQNGLCIHVKCRM